MDFILDIVHGTQIDIEYKLRFLWGKIDTRKLSEDIINLVSLNDLYFLITI